VGNKASPLQEVCTLPFLGADVLFRFLFELGAQNFMVVLSEGSRFRMEVWNTGDSSAQPSGKIIEHSA
jgi:hypothetical protein